MAAFLFQIELPLFTEEIMTTIPLHRAYINKLFEEGSILSYSVSEHRNMIWCVVSAEDEQMAMAMILKMPLFNFFADVSCHPLLFHNTLPAKLPGISLN